MKVLFTGRGTSGSWQIRGVQLGAAMGATVKRMAPQGDHDIAVVVKRVAREQLPHLRRWVYDIVDAYPQPESYNWARDQAIAWVQGEIKRLRPAAVIWPTRRMREDCDTGSPGVVIPHHARPGMTAKTDPKLVGYQGAERYLGRWRPAIERECARRGLTFVVNPADYGKLGTVVAVRDGGGYVCANWKPGTKHANALAIGARFIGNPEAGCVEQAVGGEAWVDRIEDLSAAFDAATPLTGTSYSVEQAARELSAFLHAL